MTAPIERRPCALRQIDERAASPARGADRPDKSASLQQFGSGVSRYAGAFYQDLFLHAGQITVDFEGWRPGIPV
jgi:hypothetical protein